MCCARCEEAFPAGIGAGAVWLPGGCLTRAGARPEPSRGQTGQGLGGGGHRGAGPKPAAEVERVAGKGRCALRCKRSVEGNGPCAE